jgi:hypothetical protein
MNNSKGETMKKLVSVSKQKLTVTILESLMERLASKDRVICTKARKSLVAPGKPVVPYLMRASQNSSLDHPRWEIAKTLGASVEVHLIIATMSNFMAKMD